MDRFTKLVMACALVAGSASASAGYAMPAPPLGFSGGLGIPFTFAPGGNAANQAFGRTIFQPSGPSIHVGGKPVTMPAAYRLAANAPRIAAAAIFANPYIRTGVAISAWLGVGKLIWDEASQTWREDGFGKELLTEYRGHNEVWYSSLVQACTSHLAYSKSVGGSFYSQVTQSGAKCSYYYGWTDDASEHSGPVYMDISSRQSEAGKCIEPFMWTPAGCVSPALSQPQFVEKLSPTPMPEKVPLELPPSVPLPVEPPVTNPEPGENPQPRPLFVPTGDPIANPDYNPQAAPSPQNQPYIQPGVRIVPSPTLNEPWRVDLQPVNRPTSSPLPLPEPVPEESPPEGDKPKEDTSDLCEKNPDILACQKLDEPEDQELPESEKPINITPDSGWGADNAACPAPRMLTVQGRQIPIPFDLFCTYMEGIRPIVIAMAWLSAAFILVGAREANV